MKLNLVMFLAQSLKISWIHYGKCHFLIILMILSSIQKVIFLFKKKSSSQHDNRIRSWRAAYRDVTFDGPISSQGFKNF